MRDGTEEFEICEAPAPCRAGLPGNGSGQFEEASGVAIDNSPGLTQGDIYVADPVNHRVERFGPDGEFIFGFGEAGEGPGQFAQLGINALAVGPTGTVYVADSVAGAGRVQKFSPAGALKVKSHYPSVGGIEGLLFTRRVSSTCCPKPKKGRACASSMAGQETGSPRDPGVHGGSNHRSRLGRAMSCSSGTPTR